MKVVNSIYKLGVVLIVLIFSACQDLTELNENPNGVEPSTADPNLMLSTVTSETANSYLKDMGFGDLMGVMQYTQRSGWGSGQNNFDWDSKSWSGWYGILRTNQHMYNRAVEEGMDFHVGVALIIRAFNFGVIADGWGDAPYTNALKGDMDGTENQFPVFDSQETIYEGIIEELKMANEILATGNLVNINDAADLIYNGDALKWRKFANSLMLRYYMRLSEKLPSFAEAGIAEVAGNASQFPIFTSIDDDATMSYPGNSNDFSWPSNSTYDPSRSGFARIQMCAGIRDVMIENDDPRLGVWFEKVSVPIKVSTAYSPEADIIVDGVRYLHPDSMAVKGYKVYDKDTYAANAGYVLIDTCSTYTGIPLAIQASQPYDYNLNPNPVQGGSNVHISALAEMYEDASGDMLLSRLMSYSEVCFILSEAAFKGISAGGSSQDWYEKGVKASLETWGVGDDFDDYYAHSSVAFDNTLEQIMTQKWLSNWTVASEAWFDWRRTGLPDLDFGPAGRRDAMPVRFYYGEDERNRNKDNYDIAIDRLTPTEYTTQNEGNDSAWSKMWLLQGTGKPW
jgi:hypothetical protein